MPMLAQGASVAGVAAAIHEDANGVGGIRLADGERSRSRAINFGIGPWPSARQRLAAFEQDVVGNHELGPRDLAKWMQPILATLRGSTLRPSRAALPVELTFDPMTDFNALDGALSEFSFQRDLESVIDALLPALQ
jgi:hypothetical protein